MEAHEREAYLHGGQMAFEVAQEAGKSDLSQFTGEEWLHFCEAMCKAYHIKFSELENKLLFG